MRVLTVAAALATLLSLPALWISAQSSSKATITFVIEDVDAGQPVSNKKVKLELFGPEHGARKILPCVPTTDAKPLFSSEFSTNANVSFAVSADGGKYIAEITVANRKPVFGCIGFDTPESVRACGVAPSPLFRQYALIRITKLIPRFSGDLLGNSACAAYAPSLCDPLSVPNLVQRNNIVLLESDGRPIGNARLEFREYTKGLAKVVANLTTDANGAADVSSLSRGGLLRMAVKSGHASGEFLIGFARTRTPGRQTIKLFHWRCRGDVMQGAMVQP